MLVNAHFGILAAPLGSLAAPQSTSAAPRGVSAGSKLNLRTSFRFEAAHPLCHGDPNFRKNITLPENPTCENLIYEGSES